MKNAATVTLQRLAVATAAPEDVELRKRRYRSVGSPFGGRAGAAGVSGGEAADAGAI